MATAKEGAIGDVTYALTSLKKNGEAHLEIAKKYDQPVDVARIAEAVRILDKLIDDVQKWKV